MQRAGRAGRESHGYCFRLYTEDAFNSLAASAEPEVQRSSLTSAVLQLKVIGQDMESMQFMDRPDQESGMFLLHHYRMPPDVVYRSWFSLKNTLAPRRYRQLSPSNRLWTIACHVST